MSNRLADIVISHSSVLIDTLRFPDDWKATIHL